MEKNMRIIIDRIIMPSGKEIWFMEIENLEDFRLYRLNTVEEVVAVMKERARLEDQWKQE